mmetsp:Transcript_52307/g.138686  ORF Transcript_52307/g.138686 Transcript_52307/m.138686 type:complete len:203 (-) Transcript_52307:2174-2782(-)
MKAGFPKVSPQPVAELHRQLLLTCHAVQSVQSVVHLRAIGVQVGEDRTPGTNSVRPEDRPANHEPGGHDVLLDPCGDHITIPHRGDSHNAPIQCDAVDTPRIACIIRAALRGCRSVVSSDPRLPKMVDLSPVRWQKSSHTVIALQIVSDVHANHAPGAGQPVGHNEQCHTELQQRLSCKGDGDEVLPLLVDSGGPEHANELH